MPRDTRCRRANSVIRASCCSGQWCLSVPSKRAPFPRLRGSSSQVWKHRCCFRPWLASVPGRRERPAPAAERLELAGPETAPPCPQLQPFPAAEKLELAGPGSGAAMNDQARTAAASASWLCWLLRGAPVVVPVVFVSCPSPPLVGGESEGEFSGFPCLGFTLAFLSLVFVFAVFVFAFCFSRGSFSFSGLVFAFAFRFSFQWRRVRALAHPVVRVSTPQTSSLSVVAVFCPSFCPGVVFPACVFEKVPSVAWRGPAFRCVASVVCLSC